VSDFADDEPKLTLKVERLLVQLDTDNPERADDLRAALRSDKTNAFIARRIRDRWGISPFSAKAVESWRERHLV
jgi:hypothetical protein